MIDTWCTFVLPLVRRGPIRTELNYKNMWQVFQKWFFLSILCYCTIGWYIFWSYSVICKQLAHQKNRYSSTLQNVHYFTEVSTVSILQLTIHHLTEAQTNISRHVSLETYLARLKHNEFLAFYSDRCIFIPCIYWIINTLQPLKGKKSFRSKIGNLYYW